MRRFLHFKETENGKTTTNAEGTDLKKTETMTRTLFGADFPVSHLAPLAEPFPVGSLPPNLRLILLVPLELLVH